MKLFHILTTSLNQPQSRDFNPLNLLFILQVGDPSICSKISDDLIRRFGHYVQAINFPTVARGKEVLRVAPTPHHTTDMMDAFVRDVTAIWTEVGLELRPRTAGTAR